MSNYPPGVSESSQSAPWNNYPTDAEIDRQSKLAQAGLWHLGELAEILEELGLFIELVTAKKALEELV